MKQMGNLLKQAQQMQAKMTSLQGELAGREVEADAGGGVVKVVVNGKQELVKLLIDRECVDPDEIEILQDLVKAAINQGMKKSQDMVNDAMGKVTGGLKVPGLF